MMTSKIAIVVSIITILGIIVLLNSRAKQARHNTSANKSSDSGIAGIHSDASGCSDGSSGGGCDGGGGCPTVTPVRR